MNINDQRSPEALLRKGMRDLSNHRPDRALESLRAAVDGIPASCSDELSRALYWLSVALLRLDRRELAVKSLASAQKLRRRGIARRAYLKHVNEYGMPRRPTPELDDFYAFTSIRLAAYLARKLRRRFDSAAERDAVMRLLADSWRRLSLSGALSDMSCGSKLEAFRRPDPLMPAFGLAGAAAATPLRIIQADFRRGARPSADDRCACGSGLPYRICCGRTPGLREL